MTQTDAPLPLFPHRHLLGIRDLSPPDIEILLDRADRAVSISRQSEKKTSTLRGRTQINLFFESSTRTQSSFELAGKRLGADVMNMSVASSSVKKGETLIDTAMTLNAMRPDHPPPVGGCGRPACAEGGLLGGQCR
jgi:aspartate carbamoyltransferase catalytic subunit